MTVLNKSHQEKNRKKGGVERMEENSIEDNMAL